MASGYRTGFGKVERGEGEGEMMHRGGCKRTEVVDPGLNDVQRVGVNE